MFVETTGDELARDMDLRDYFAAKAASGLADVLRAPGRAEQIAKMAYEIADAMLTEREKR